jgi:cyclin-dependent kinase 8/11
LEHENVVHLKEVLLDPFDRSIYLVYDYAEHDLLQLIQWYRSRRLGMPEDMIKSIMWQLLNGVAYLHANWVLHRDIKPANILIMGRGPQMGILKIADLGLGRLYLAPLIPLSSMDKTIVTIWYRAPELLLKAKHYTKAVGKKRS